MVNVRLAGLGDARLLAAFDRETNLTFWSEENYVSSLSNPTNLVYLLENSHGGILSAMVLGTTADQADILQFWVVRYHQRRGYATYMLNYMLKELMAKKKDGKVFLEVVENNTAAVELYLNWGFTIIGKRKNYYKINGMYYNALIMSYVYNYII